jgi:hypothetical protein
MNVFLFDLRSGIWWTKIKKAITLKYLFGLYCEWPAQHWFFHNQQGKDWFEARSGSNAPTGAMTSRTAKLVVTQMF